MAKPPLTITLTGPLQAYVEERVASGHHATPDAFVHDLIRRDQAEQRTRIEAELRAAQQSGELPTAQEWMHGQTVVSTLRQKQEQSSPDHPNPDHPSPDQSTLERP